MTATATFAAGCFWGVETSFRSIPGVKNTTVGYAGGKTPNPSYEQVCTGATGHAESVMVEFDPDIVSYDRLLEVFWSIHDPCTRDRQGPDVGSQYRSVIFYRSAGQMRSAISSMQSQNKAGRCGKGEVVTEIVPFSAFYPAEEYHQRYLEKRGQTACSR